MEWLQSRPERRTFFFFSALYSSDASQRSFFCRSTRCSIVSPGRLSSCSAAGLGVLSPPTFLALAVVPPTPPPPPSSAATSSAALDALLAGALPLGFLCPPPPFRFFLTWDKYVMIVFGSGFMLVMSSASRSLKWDDSSPAHCQRRDRLQCECQREATLDEDENGGGGAAVAAAWTMRVAQLLYTASGMAAEAGAPPGPRHSLEDPELFPGVEG